MTMRMLWAALVVSLLMGRVEAASSTPPIIVRGNKLYNSATGERFFMKGMTYEYAVSDDSYIKYSKQAIRTNLKGLKFNTLRLYHINPEESYDLFMKDMAAMGVYVLISASPDNDPYYGKYRYSTITKNLGPNGKETTASNGVKTMDLTKTCYPALLLEYGKRIIQKFAAYDNTLGIVIANEIMQADLTAAACVKQYAADLKNWMRVNAKKIRLIPLAYAEADSAAKTKATSSDEYVPLRIQGLLCGDKMKDGMMTKSIDIFLLNEYRWCPGSTFAEAYQRVLNFASGAPIVLGLGEYGCHNAATPPRDWGMVKYLYGKPADTNQFSDIFSGGMAYSFGEAKLEHSFFPMFTGGSVDPMGEPGSTPTADYANLKAQFDKYIPFVEKSAWKSSDDRCKWTPTVLTQVTATNVQLARTSGNWLIDCDDDRIKVDSSDTWITKSREGVVCTDQGATCDVKISEIMGTTQEDLCGEVHIEVGGAACKASSDCGVNGQCVDGADGKQCKCTGCFSGTQCEIRDMSRCTSLSSSPNAPKYVFAAVGVFLAVMVVVFTTLVFAGQRQKRAMEKLGNQLNLRAPSTHASSQTGRGTTL